MVFMLHATFGMRIGHYIGIPNSCLQIGAGICAVHTADAVATIEVNYYNFFSSILLASMVCEDDQPGVL